MDFHTNLFWNSWPLSFFISRPEWVFAWADLTTIDPSVYLKNETNWMHEISNIRSLTWVSSRERKNLAYFNNNWVNNAVKICLEPPFFLRFEKRVPKLAPRSKFCRKTCSTEQVLFFNSSSSMDCPCNRNHLHNLKNILKNYLHKVFKWRFIEFIL